ncbi:MAG: helix-turn-helix domain-containing protein [Chloroflexi bacterium]|nr:helix-turn-helix domain-containing protein [Chloroflexota bacterium]
MSQRKQMRPVSQPTSKGDDEMNKDLIKYVTTREAAEMLGVATTHVNRLLIGEKIRGIKKGHDWLVFAPSLEKYLANKSKRGRPSSGSPTIQVQEKSNGQG